MGQFVKRVMNVLRGKSNAVLEKLEKPEEQLSVFIDELNDQMSGLQKSVAAAMADEKRLKMQLDDLNDKADQWEAKAILALKSGDENLAREALLQKDACLQQVAPIQKSWEVQKDATMKLRASLTRAKSQVEEAKRKYTLLVAKYKTAETNKKLTQTLTSNDNSAQQMMDRLNDRIVMIESENEANQDLLGDSNNAELEARFVQLEKKSRGDEALMQLKQKLAGSDPAAINPVSPA
jgi:phage shock protein A